MARGRQGHRSAEPSEASSQGGESGQKAPWRVSGWDRSVKYSERSQQLTIAMPGWGLSDEDMKVWCTWFESYAASLPGWPCELSARDVNVSENQLTAAGVRSFLETLASCRVSVMVLKLHHNFLDNGAGVAAFLRNCNGSLRELHLSHNELTTEAAAEIVLATAIATGDDGAPCYPRIVGGSHGPSPLWLRMEQNFVSPTELSERVEPAFRALGRKGAVALCNVSSKACTPHTCAKYRHDPPVIHTKHLANQRPSPPPPPAAPSFIGAAPWQEGGDSAASSPQHARGQGASAVPDAHAKSSAKQRLKVPAPPPPAPSGLTSSQNILALLQGGRGAKEEPERRVPGPPIGSQPSRHAPVGGVTQAEKADEKDHAKCEVADVLRWDEELFMWIKDTIEIPDEPEESADASGRIKISTELGSIMGNELKSILQKPRAEGFLRSAASQQEARPPPRPPPGYEEVARIDYPDAPPIPGRLLDSSEVETGTSSQKPAVGSAARSSRRGAQPSSSDVKQAKNSWLNPQATEFVPTVPAFIKTPAVTSQVAPSYTLLSTASPSSSKMNPEAEEFRPNGPLSTTPENLPKSMRGISESLIHMHRAGTAMPTSVATGFVRTGEDASRDAKTSQTSQQGDPESAEQCFNEGVSDGEELADSANSAVGPLLEHDSATSAKTRGGASGMAPQMAAGGDSPSPATAASASAWLEAAALDAAGQTCTEVDAKGCHGKLLESESDNESVQASATDFENEAADLGNESVKAGNGVEITTKLESEEESVAPQTSEADAAAGLECAAATQWKGEAPREGEAMQDAETSIGRVFRCAFAVISAMVAFGTGAVVARRRRK